MEVHVSSMAQGSKDFSRTGTELHRPFMVIHLVVSWKYVQQGRRNTFKTRGAEDSRYTRGRFASEKIFEAN